MISLVNGYVCLSCADVALAKKDINPANPQDNPANPAYDPSQAKASFGPAVTFAGTLATAGTAPGISPPAARQAAATSGPAKALDISV
jgi:hypothetical protein